ncbi:MAG: hypothetical protein MZV64_28610 [Ignavibacteriales bacterium]|nr:hypothetical protein [Ignavibacteriales bacterium]
MRGGAGSSARSASRVSVMTPGEHDQEAALTQGITHYIGRVLKDFGVRPSSDRDPRLQEASRDRRADLQRSLAALPRPAEVQSLHGRDARAPREIPRERPFRDRFFP